MHIGFCGPATLDSLRDLVGQPIQIKGYPFRGSSTLIREYIAQGHRVTLFTTSPDIQRTITFSGTSLKVVAVPTRSRGYRRAFDFFAEERRSLVWHIRQESPDVLHAHWTYEFGLAARDSGVPSVVTVHDWAPAVASSNRHPYWYFRWAMQIRCLLYPGVLTAPSSYIAGRVSRYFRKPCLVIPNGIDVASFKPQFQRNDRQNLRIGMLNVGFSSRKNVHKALRAWSIIHAEYPSAVLIAAGPGYEPGGEAHQWAIQNHVAERVEFLGSVSADDVPEWLSGLDIFLHPSLEESFGMVLLEAMAAGVPVIAGRDAGAVPVVTGGNAMLTDVTSTNALAETLALSLSDEGLRGDLSEAGLDWSKKFGVEESASRFITELSRLT